MDPKNKLVLQVNHDYLLKSLNVHEVLSKLYEQIKFSSDDCERVRAEVTTEDKVIKLLKILTRKSNDAYEVFIESVDLHIQSRLKSTVVPDDVLEKEKQKIDDFIKDVLLRFFCEDEDEKVSFSSLEDIVHTEFLRSGKPFSITQDQLKYLVTKNFPSAKEKMEKKKNIARIQTESSDEDHSVTTEQTPEQTSETEAVNEQEQELGTLKLTLDHMTVKDICLLLEPVFISEGFGNEIVEVLREQEISGEIFKSLTIDDTLQLFQKLVFGKRKKVLLIRDKILQEGVICPNKTDQDKAKTHCSVQLLSFRETFRKFDTPTRNIDSYKQASILNTSVTRPHNLIEPVHLFVQTDNISQKKLLKWIAGKTVQFACACMNDRTNGTIHFGVNSRPKPDEVEGKIVGVALDKSKCKEIIQKTILESFYDDQLDIIFKCIRPVEFVNVITKVTEHTPLHIVEVDVVPDSSLLEDEAVFIKSPNRTLYRFPNDSLNPKLLSYDETYEYMKIKKRLNDCRKAQEGKPKTIEIKQDLRQKFLNLFTGGNDHLCDETYPILFLSPLDSNMDVDYAENFQFVKDIDPCVVFDFDSSSDRKGMYHFIEINQEQVVKALTTDNFDKNSEENRQNQDTHSHVFDDLRTSSFKPWIFCNGYDVMEKPPMEILQWKQSRSEGFKEALRFFNDEIPRGRAKVIFLLFSKNYETMLEAAEDVLIKFQDQWILLAENYEIADHWMSELIRRKSVDKEIMKHRCILGLPWMHVNQMIQQVMMPSRRVRCEIPCSNGAIIHLREKVRNELCDLEIIGVNECDINDFEQHSRAKHRRRVQEDFFRGGQVTWWNFWYGDDHVLRRTLGEKIKKLIQSGIAGHSFGEDDKVSTINLVHQPGAGGTTTARQILWDMRENSRCCVVRQITDQTCDQIATLRNFEDPEVPLPPIVLLDNCDEDKVQNLVMQLENRARLATRRSEEGFKIFCVLLLCTRRTKLPMEVSYETVILKQELDKRELEWFDIKNKSLEENFQKKEGVDPRLLISFNILKENFNPDYIKRTVQQYVEGISAQQEKDLLLYLSMINTYDLDFKSVPVSAFDQLMTTNSSKGKRQVLMYGLVSPARNKINQQKQWESHISSELQVLLNRSSRAGFGTNLKALTIINPLFSREIFECLLKQTSMSTSDAMLQFLNSPVFESCNRSIIELMNIVKDIFKKREELANGKKEKFSPFITEILQKDPDKAAEVMIEGFKKTDDPMIAQQIARLYIHCKNWEEAHKFAKKATQMKPKNSYLWDTYGLVYKHMLLEKYDKFVQNGETVTIEDTKECVKIAVEGLEKFHREQQISEEEKGAFTNDAGYFNEVRLVIVLLDILAFSQFEKKDIHRFLVDDSFSNTHLDNLGSDTQQHLRHLHTFTEIAMRKLEEKSAQLKDSTINSILRYKYGHFQQQMLLSLRENVDYYFGEDTDEVPDNLTEAEKADFRRRRVRRLGGNLLAKILSLRRSEDGEERLQAIYAHVSENITSHHFDSSDLRNLIGVVIALNITTEKTPLPFSVMIENSKKLYGREVDSPEECPSLEPFLFLLLFHWPSENKKDKNLFPIGKLNEVIKKWKNAFYKNHPRHREEKNPFRKRETTYFFLGKGPEYKEIVYYEELHDLHAGKYYKGDEVWEKPQTIRKLKRMEGTLVKDGTEVTIQLETKEGNKFPVSIPTAMPIGQRQFWQKRVFFYLGFTWAGPKAFDVSQNPRQQQNISRTGDSKKVKNGDENLKSFSEYTASVVTHAPKYLSYIQDTSAKLREIRGKKEKGKNLQDLEEQEKKLAEKLRTLLQQRQETLGT